MNSINLLEYFIFEDLLSITITSFLNFHISINKLIFYKPSNYSIFNRKPFIFVNVSTIKYKYI